MKRLPEYFRTRPPHLAHEEFVEVHRIAIGFSLRAYSRARGKNFSPNKFIGELYAFWEGIGFAEPDKKIIEERFQSYQNIALHQNAPGESNPIDISPSTVRRLLGGSEGRGPLRGTNKGLCSVARDFLIWHGFLTETQLYHAAQKMHLAFGLADELDPQAGDGFRPDSPSKDGNHQFVHLSKTGTNVEMLTIDLEKIQTSIYRVVLARRVAPESEAVTCESLDDLLELTDEDGAVQLGWLFSADGATFGCLSDARLESSSSFSICRGVDSKLRATLGLDKSLDDATSNKNNDQFDILPHSEYNFTVFRKNNFKFPYIRGPRRYSDSAVVNKILSDLSENEHKILEIMRRVYLYKPLSGPKTDYDVFDDLDAAVKLIKSGTSMAARDDHDWTALHYAAAGSNGRVLDAAIERGVSDPGIDFLSTVRTTSFGEERDLKPFQMWDHLPMSAGTRKNMEKLYDAAVKQGAARGLSLNEINSLPSDAPELPAPEDNIM